MTVKLISMFPNVKVSLPSFIYENKFFMLYNVPRFSVKSAFFIRFIGSFFVIKLIIHRQSEPLRSIDIINKS